MSTTHLVLEDIDFEVKPEDIVVGIDSGALTVIRRKLPLHIALGDFDSVSALNRQQIKDYARQMVVLNPIKDASDSEAAVTYLQQHGYHNLVLHGGLHRRFDHAFVNLQLVAKYGITIDDYYNLIYQRLTGEHIIPKLHYKYLSLFTLSKAVLSIEHVKYPLTKVTIDEHTSYTLSNEILDDYGKLTVFEGSVIVIQSRD